MFISHAGLQKDRFAFHLQRVLGGATACLAERSISPDKPSRQCMEDACRGAKLVIFVVTRQFLRSQWCMDELRWTLDQRQTSGKGLPEMLTVLYPGHVVPGFSPEQLERMAALDSKDQVIDLLKVDTINVDHLYPLTPDLERLIASHSLPQPPERHQSHKQLEAAKLPVSLEQRKMDLRALAGSCCMRDNAHGRCYPMFNHPAEILVLELPRAPQQKSSVTVSCM